MTNQTILLRRHNNFNSKAIAAGLAGPNVRWHPGNAGIVQGDEVGSSRAIAHDARQAKLILIKANYSRAKFDWRANPLLPGRLGGE